MRHIAQEPDSGGDLGGGAGLAALEANPFRLARPLRQSVPFVFAFPHSGRLYPPEFLCASRLSPLALRRSEDAFVDTLIEDAAIALGAPAIAARFPRAFVDANRAPGELDPAMFSGTLDLSVDAPGPRVAAGLGVIPRIVRDGVEIYAGRLPAAEAAARLTKLYRPYHAALLALVEETQKSFGAAVVLDCHSMPSIAAAPDIVLGDRFGTAASSQLSNRAQAAFTDQGFRVVRNSPYAGGFTTQLYGRPARGIHALQIEINRDLYLDEEAVVASRHFPQVQARIAAALANLLAIPLDALGATTRLPWAAE